MNTLRCLLLALAVAGIFTGCKSLEPDNTSERPWNVQEGWQGGLPSNINQGR